MFSGLAQASNSGHGGAIGYVQSTTTIFEEELSWLNCAGDVMLTVLDIVNSRTSSLREQTV